MVLTQAGHRKDAVSSQARVITRLLAVLLAVVMLPLVGPVPGAAAAAGERPLIRSFAASRDQVTPTNRWQG